MWVSDDGLKGIIEVVLIAKLELNIDCSKKRQGIPERWRSRATIHDSKIEILGD